jgi:hypothetical protein
LLLSFLEKFPETMEELLNAAEEDGNKWLIDLIKAAYTKKPDSFAIYFLVPPFQNDLQEITESI